MPYNATLPQQLRSKHDAVKAHDDKLYGDWKSADIIFADAKERPNLVGRWDWHAWQFLLALMPAGMIYGLAQYARYDMEHNPIPKQQKQGSAAAAIDAEQEKSKKELEERLSAVETTLRTIITTLEKKSPPPNGNLGEKATSVQPQATPPPKPP
ncbi:hypothetical protein NADE_004869 [Nannochloris sp. 'desiccata']|nr:hypothetical protein NADE_004869 [Chlorella desiccata (nom. nud.)]